MTKTCLVLYILLIGCCISCSKSQYPYTTNTVSGEKVLDTNDIWLSHEHTLVDFIGADSIDSNDWNHNTVIKEMLPFFNELSKHNVKYFVDATPNYIGRDVELLKKIADTTGIEIITNTGFYGARNNKYIPSYARDMTPQQLSNIWIDEFNNGINETSIRPGFIKIGVDASDPLHPMHKKLVKAAALAHLKTGLTIASHTGKADGVWPQLDIIKKMGVSPKAFIWVHANQENNLEAFVKAAKIGCWISFDGLGWETEGHIEKLIFAKKHNILDKILISHDAGWYDPQKKIQDIKPYTNLFKIVIPKLKSEGFTSKDIDLLLKVNPAKAFSLGIKKEKY